MSTPATPALAVVIPTYNRRARLSRVLEALAHQDTTADFEVVVVNDGSTDDTETYLASCDLPISLRWQTQPNSGPATARNLAVDLASAAIIVFLDDDVVPTEGLLEAHRRAQEESGRNTVVIGPMIDPPDHPLAPWVCWEQRMLHKQYEAMTAGTFEPTFRQFYTGNASIPRADVLANGGFDHRLRRAEDVELGIRLWERGTKFVYAPDAVGLHYAERSFRAWRDVARAYGEHEVDFAREGSRDWQWEFLRYNYRSRHLLVRAFTNLCLRKPNTYEAAASRLEPVIERLHRSPGRKLAQWSLSAIYAVDYWRAATQALGGPAALDRLVRTGNPPGQIDMARAEPGPSERHT